MNDNKKNRLKGSVLYTVIAVMMIMTVFVFAALTLAASANKRAHNVYANNQTQYTARSVVDGMMTILEKNGKDAVGTVDVDKLNASLDSSWGKVTAASIQDVGSILDLENKGINFGLSFTNSQKTEIRVYKLSATVNMQGQENTVALYCYSGEEEKPYLFTNALTSMGEMPLSFSQHTYPINGDVYANINNEKYPYIINYGFHLIVNGAYGLRGSVEDFHHNAEFTLDKLNKGIFIEGYMKANNNYPFTVALANGVTVKDVPYKQLPYMFVGETLYARGMGSAPLTIGTSNRPFIVMTDAIKLNNTTIEGAETAEFQTNANIFGDLYLYAQKDNTSYISSKSMLPVIGADGNPTGEFVLDKDARIHPWDPGCVDVKTASNKEYTGGNIYSLGTIIAGGEQGTLGNNIVSENFGFLNIGYGSKDYTTTGAVVSKNVDLTGAAIARDRISFETSELNFSNGLFTDPSTFNVTRRQIVNGIECNFEKAQSLGSSKTTQTISLDNHDGNYYWNEQRIYPNERHDFEFKLADIPGYDPNNENMYVVPKSIEIEWEPMTVEMVNKLNLSVDLCEFNYDINHYGYNKVVSHNDVNVDNPENKLTIPLNNLNMKDSQLQFKLSNVEGYKSPRWERLPWIGPDWGVNRPDVGHWENLHWVKTDRWGNGYWEKDEGYTEEIRERRDQWGYVYYEHFTTDPTTIQVKSISINVEIYENILDPESYLKKVNNVAFANSDGNVIYIDDIDKSVKLEKTIDSTTGRTVMNISMAKTGESAYILQNSYDYENAYSDFLRAVVDTVTFPESMRYSDEEYNQKMNEWNSLSEAEKQKTPAPKLIDRTLDKNGGFVDTSFMSESNIENINNHTKSYDELKNSELKDVNIYKGACGYGTPVDGNYADSPYDGWHIIDKTTGAENWNTSDIKVFDEAHPLTENCILTGDFKTNNGSGLQPELHIDPQDKELYIGLADFSLSNTAHIVVHNNGNGTGKVNFIVLPKDTTYAQGHTTTTGKVSLWNATVLTDYFYNQWKKEDGTIKIESKPTDKRAIPNIYFYLDPNDENGEYLQTQSLVSAYILAPNNTINISDNNYYNIDQSYNITYDGQDTSSGGHYFETLIGSAIGKKYNSGTNTTFTFIDERGANLPDDTNKVGKFTKLYYQAY